MDETGPTLRDKLTRTQRAGGLVPADPATHAATITNLNLLIDELRCTVSEQRVRIYKLTAVDRELSSHRDGIIELANNLRVIPRWHWIRRNRIRAQLAAAAESIARRTPRVY